ncbi:unnamed protein product [Ixodes hexagonus]
MLSPLAMNLERFPARLCSYLVFTRRLDNQAPPLDVIPVQDAKYESFLRLCATTETAAIIATVTSALSPLFADGALVEGRAARLSGALLKEGLSGVAVLADRSENLDLFDRYLEDILGYFHTSASPLRLFAAVHYHRDFELPILKRLVSDGDVPTGKNTMFGMATRMNSTWMQNFEDEQTAEDKAYWYMKIVDNGCVAAFHADFEDSRGVCPGRRAYSRLKKISGLVEMSRVWHSFLPAQRPTAPLAVGVNSATLVSAYESNVNAGSSLVESVPTWLKRNGVQGVVVLIGALSAQEELLMYRILRFKADTETPSLGDQCGAESLVNYSEVCSLPGSQTVFDMTWMSASSRSGDVLYTFEKEEVLLSKVLFLKSWLPSLCVATFHTELDSASCTRPFARLMDVRAALGGSRA